jgi:hypothetical protein
MSEFNPETANLQELEAELERVLGDPDQPIQPVDTIVDTGPTPPQTEESQPEAIKTEPTEEAKSEQPKADEPDLDHEMRSAREQEWEARAKHWEQIAGRHGSELGALRKVVAELQVRTSQPAQPADEFQQQDATPPSPKPATEDPFRLWALRQAAVEGYQAFQSAHPDAKEYGDGIKKYLEDSGYNAESILVANDPGYAQQEVSRVFTEAYWKVKADAQAARAAELREKKATQTAALRSAKEKAATSATASTPAPRPVEKDIKDMSIAELESALDKETGGTWRGNWR